MLRAILFVFLSFAPTLLRAEVPLQLVHSVNLPEDLDIDWGVSDICHLFNDSDYVWAAGKDSTIYFQLQQNSGIDSIDLPFEILVPYDWEGPFDRLEIVRLRLFRTIYAQEIPQLMLSVHGVWGNPPIEERYTFYLVANLTTGEFLDLGHGFMGGAWEVIDRRIDFIVSPAHPAPCRNVLKASSIHQVSSNGPWGHTQEFGSVSCFRVDSTTGNLVNLWSRPSTWIQSNDLRPSEPWFVFHSTSDVSSDENGGYVVHESFSTISLYDSLADTMPIQIDSTDNGSAYWIEPILLKISDSSYRAVLPSYPVSFAINPMSGDVVWSEAIPLFGYPASLHSVRMPNGVDYLFSQRANLSFLIFDAESGGLADSTTPTSALARWSMKTDNGPKEIVCYEESSRDLFVYKPLSSPPLLTIYPLSELPEVLLSWTPDPFAQSYTLQIANNSEMQQAAEELLDGSQTTYRFTTEGTDKRFFRVIANY